MRFRLNKKAVSIMLVLIISFVLVSCSLKTENKPVTKDDIKSEITTSDKNDSWVISVNGKEIALPCPLTDFLDAGLELNDYDKEQIYPSSNQTFSLISAIHKETYQAISLEIVTGDKPDKEEKNATVWAVTNINMDSTLCSFKNNVALGSSFDEVISSFGDNYELTGASNEDDPKSGYSMILYQKDDYHAIFHFTEGVTSYMEIVAEREG